MQSPQLQIFPILDSIEASNSGTVSLGIRSAHGRRAFGIGVGAHWGRTHRFAVGTGAVAHGGTLRLGALLGSSNGAGNRGDRDDIGVGVDIRSAHWGRTHGFAVGTGAVAHGGTLLLGGTHRLGALLGSSNGAGNRGDIAVGTGAHWGRTHGFAVGTGAAHGGTLLLGGFLLGSGSGLSSLLLRGLLSGQVTVVLLSSSDG